ncbi:MAG: asparaginase [Flavobacteriaceae bacterium]|nr:asparaginase [Flavobacteriaceae bacterium]
MQKTKILLIYTGGTIGMVKDYKTGALRAFDFDQLLERIPELYQLDCEVCNEAFEEPLDSSDMNVLHWQRIAKIIETRYEEFDGFVVLHGSDTMSYTASALSFMLENLSKPVVFTGSQLPIGDLRTDAKENLITAVQIASLQEQGQAVVQEVCLYFEYKLYRANRTTKINAEHFEAFESFNYPPLAESGVHLKVDRSRLLRPIANAPLVVHYDMVEAVGLVKLFPGMCASSFQHMMSDPKLRVVVLETYGAGNAPTTPWFLKTLSSAVERGLHIVNVTQCSGGSVVMGRYKNSTQLQEMQLISGKDITTEAALAKAMYLLGLDLDFKRFKAWFEVPLRGEIQ